MQVKASLPFEDFLSTQMSITKRKAFQPPQSINLQKVATAVE